MKRTATSWWVTTTAIFIPLLIFFGIALLFWLQLIPSDRLLLTRIFERHFLYFFGVTTLLMVAIGFFLAWIYRNHIIPTTRLAEEAELIQVGNPSHRIQITGGRDIRRVAKIINEWATRIESKRDDIDEKITHAKSDSEAEKNILAAFMAELPEGVLICNVKGKILLYNKQAKLFLAGGRDAKSSDRSPETASYQIVGLGRWVTDVIPPDLIEHALNEIKSKLQKKEPDAAAYFVMNQNDRLLRVETVPILDHLQDFTGFILIFHNITEQIQTEGRIRFLWQSLTGSVTSSLTTIRSAIETVLAYPDMSADRRNQLKQLIHKQTLIMGNVLSDTMSEYTGCCMDSRWPLVFIQDQVLLDMIRERAAKSGIDLRIVDHGDNRPSVGWIKVESYSMTLAICFILYLLKQTTGLDRFSGRLKKTGRFVGLDLLWMGKPVKIEALKKWEDRMVTVGRERLPFTVKEIMGYHHMEIGSYPGRRETDLSHLRIFMPAFNSPEPGRKRGLTILPESRPEFFDFDLFHQAGQTQGLDNRRLSELTYTVFDTETTGLDINGGDRIVSIAAIRIVNGKPLLEEKFDQLVDPQRTIPAESTRIHGITDDMVKGHPAIEDVLPLFDRFAEETVLVAHNAAFDMRLLQINEPYTGIKFEHPVLDTLLLSAVVHPSQNDHGLRGITKRLGVPVIGRHTAIGDTITTANLFLKLLSLLSERGIHTLKDAREASQKTYFARLKY